MKKLLCFLLLLVAPATSPALEKIGVGGEPPVFSLSTPDGATVSLDYFKGGPGVIVFWSTWSPRSAELLGDLKDWHARWGGTALKVLAVNADREVFSVAAREAVVREAGMLQLPFPVVFDEGLRAYAAYGVMALPSTVVVGADGRIAYTLAGYPLSYREELQQRMLAAAGNEPPAALPIAADAPGSAADTAIAAAAAPRTDCVLPRAHYCRFRDDGDRSGDDPGIAALRLAICRGDAEEATRLLPVGGMERFDRADVRFALAELLLLKGGQDEARLAFAALQQRFPAEPWGEWGLGLLALAAGKDHEALAHMERAAARGGACVEAETAVLQHLQTFWLERRRAPAEAGFLAIFSGLASVRNCFVQPRQLAGG